MHTLRLSLVILGLSLLQGCAATRATTAAARSEAAAPDPRGVVIFRGESGAPAAWGDVVDACVNADAVLIGENHGHALGLASAAALWGDVLERSPRGALALEFFERGDQSHIDDYLAGLTDEAGFKKAARRSEGSYPAGHREMVEAARARSRPVLAANAPMVYVRAARKQGYDALRGVTAEQARLFRVPDSLPTGRYRADFDKLMGGSESHNASPKGASEARSSFAGQRRSSAAPAPGAAAEPHSPTPEEIERLDGSFRSQSLWDWTMAESVSRSLSAGNSPTFLVIGRFHVAHDGGTVQALRALSPGARVVVVLYADETASALGDDERGAADFVIYVGPGKA